MGYRSEVAWVLRFSSAEKLESYVNLLRYKHDEHIDRALREIQQAGCEEDYLLCFYGDYLKWYEEFPEVKAHHFIMEHAVELYEDDPDAGVGWRFLRVGEEQNDIEETSGGNDEDLWQYIYTSTTISNNLPAGKPVIEVETKEGETV